MNSNAIWAVVINGIVQNTVVWDQSGSWSPPDGAEIVPIPDESGVCVGWDYVDGEFFDNRPVEENDLSFLEATEERIGDEGDVNGPP